MRADLPLGCDGNRSGVQASGRSTVGDGATGGVVGAAGLHRRSRRDMGAHADEQATALVGPRSAAFCQGQCDAAVLRLRRDGTGRRLRTTSDTRPFTLLRWGEILVLLFFLLVGRQISDGESLA